mmetsp:Transcript_46137/g.128189  ORF Transcript_46137/g.128189 Transcript_46137/m.128189 type:complete len:249 (-) Transcript_46137:386-1132(-)
MQQHQRLGAHLHGRAERRERGERELGGVRKGLSEGRLAIVVGGQVDETLGQDGHQRNLVCCRRGARGEELRDFARVADAVWRRGAQAAEQPQPRRRQVEDSREQLAHLLHGRDARAQQQPTRLKHRQLLGLTQARRRAKLASRPAVLGAAVLQRRRARRGRAGGGRGEFVLRGRLLREDLEQAVDHLDKGGRRRLERLLHEAQQQIAGALPHGGVGVVHATLVEEAPERGRQVLRLRDKETVEADDDL